MFVFYTCVCHTMSCIFLVGIHVRRMGTSQNIPPNSRNGHGHKNGTLVCQHTHGRIGRKLLASYPIKPTLWKRYIDDILCFWPSTSHELDQFIKYLDQFHPTIKFTHECSTNSVDFLDLTIYKGQRHVSSRILDIKPFFKLSPPQRHVCKHNQR